MNLHYDIVQLTAMKWIDEIWNDLDSTILFNFWMETGLIGKQVRRRDSRVIASTCESETAEIIEFLKSHFRFNTVNTSTSYYSLTMSN